MRCGERPKAPSHVDSPESDHLAAKQKDELDHQDHHHCQFQQKCPALVEVVDHKSIEVAGSLQLLRDEIFVIRNSYLCCRQPIEPRGEHIAEKLDGIVRVLGELHYLQQQAVKRVGGACHAPSAQESGALLERCVYAFQLTCQQLVVMTELEQLRVCVFQQLDRRLRSGSRVVEKRSIPSDDCEIVRIKRDARLQHLVRLTLRQPGALAAHDLRHQRALLLQQLNGARQLGDLADVKDKIIFTQPFFIGLDQCRRGTLQPLLYDA